MMEPRNEQIPAALRPKPNGGDSNHAKPVNPVVIAIDQLLVPEIAPRKEGEVSETQREQPILPSLPPPPASATPALGDQRYYTQRVVDLVVASFPLMALPLRRYLATSAVTKVTRSFSLRERRAVADLFSTAKAMYLSFMEEHRDDKEECGSEWWESVASLESPTATSDSNIKEIARERVRGLWKTVIHDYLKEGRLRIAMLFKTDDRFGRQMLSDASVGSGLDSPNEDYQRPKAREKARSGRLCQLGDESDSGSEGGDSDSDFDIEFAINGDGGNDETDTHASSMPRHEQINHHGVRGLINYCIEQKYLLHKNVFLLEGHRFNLDVKRFIYGSQRQEVDKYCWFHDSSDGASDLERFAFMGQEIARLTPVTPYVQNNISNWAQQAKQSVTGLDVTRPAEGLPTQALKFPGLTSYDTRRNAADALSGLRWGYDPESKTVIGPRIAFDILKVILLEFKLVDLQSLYFEHVQLLDTLRLQKESRIKLTLTLNTTMTPKKIAQQAASLLGQDPVYKAVAANLLHIGTAIVDCAGHVQELGSEIMGRRAKMLPHERSSTRACRGQPFFHTASSEIATIAAQNRWIRSNGAICSLDNSELFSAPGVSDSSLLARVEAPPIRTTESMQMQQQVKPEITIISPMFFQSLQQQRQQQCPDKHHYSEFVVALNVLMARVLDELKESDDETTVATAAAAASKAPPQTGQRVSSLEHLMLTNALQFYKSELSQTCSMQSDEAEDPCHPVCSPTESLSLEMAAICMAEDRHPPQQPSLFCDQELTYLARQYPYAFYLFIKYMALPYLKIEEAFAPSSSAGTEVTPPTDAKFSAQDLQILIAQSFVEERQRNVDIAKSMSPDECFQRTSRRFIPLNTHAQHEPRFRTQWLAVGFDELPIPNCADTEPETQPPPRDSVWLIL